MIKLINMGRKGITYLEEMCWSFSGYIEKIKNNKNQIHKTFTYLPDDFRFLSSTDNLSAGGKCGESTRIFERQKKKFINEKRKIPPLILLLAEFIECYLKKNKDFVCYFNEYLIETQELIDTRQAIRVKQINKLDILTFKNQIHFILKSSNSDKYDIADMLVYAGVPGPPYFSGFISNYVPSNKKMNEKEFLKLLNETTVVFTGMYDAEGVLLCETKKGKDTVISVFDELEIPYKYDEL